MYKAKLCSFAIACMIGSIGISPMTALAAETKSEAVPLSETNQDRKDKKAAFEEKKRQACEKWNALTTKEKDEIYASIEAKINAEIKTMDKLVKYGVFQKEDADNYKTRLLNRFEKLKESGEFPLFREHKGRKK